MQLKKLEKSVQEGFLGTTTFGFEEKDKRIAERFIQLLENSGFKNGDSGSMVFKMIKVLDKTHEIFVSLSSYWQPGYWEEKMEKAHYLVIVKI